MENKTELVLYAVIVFVVLNMFALCFVITKHFGEPTNKLSFSLGDMIKGQAEDAVFKNLTKKNIKTKTSKKAKKSAYTNTLNISPEMNSATFIIHEPEEFDYKTRTEVFATRVKLLKKYEKDDLEYSGGKFAIVRDYKPSDKVFGNIQSGRPWWGFKGLVCKGAGSKAKAGLSEESRFINNPMMLIGIDTNWAWTISQWDCPDIYPKPTSLHLIPTKKKFIAMFRISDFHKEVFSQIRWGDLNPKDFEHFYVLNALNARDFGYEYGYVANSKNIDFKHPENISNHVYRFRNYIGLGGSCGVDGIGCNNGSPRQQEMEFKIEKYPAEMTIHLFKKRPETTSAEPDIVFQINIQ